jgi:hypothetical protein
MAYHKYDVLLFFAGSRPDPEGLIANAVVALCTSMLSDTPKSQDGFQAGRISYVMRSSLLLETDRDECFCQTMQGNH